MLFVIQRPVPLLFLLPRRAYNTRRGIPMLFVGWGNWLSLHKTVRITSVWPVTMRSAGRQSLHNYTLGFRALGPMVLFQGLRTYGFISGPQDLWFYFRASGPMVLFQGLRTYGFISGPQDLWFYFRASGPMVLFQGLRDLWFYFRASGPMVLFCHCEGRYMTYVN